MKRVMLIYTVTLSRPRFCVLFGMDYYAEMFSVLIVSVFLIVIICFLSLNSPAINYLSFPSVFKLLYFSSVLLVVYGLRLVGGACMFLFSLCFF